MNLYTDSKEKKLTVNHDSDKTLQAPKNRDPMMSSECRRSGPQGIGSLHSWEDLGVQREISKELQVQMALGLHCDRDEQALLTNREPLPYSHLLLGSGGDHIATYRYKFETAIVGVESIHAEHILHSEPRIPCTE